MYNVAEVSRRVVAPGDRCPRARGSGLTHVRLISGRIIAKKYMNSWLLRLEFLFLFAYILAFFQNFSFGNMKHVHNADYESTRIYIFRVGSEVLVISKNKNVSSFQAIRTRKKSDFCRKSVSNLIPHFMGFCHLHFVPFDST